MSLQDDDPILSSGGPVPSQLLYRRNVSLSLLPEGEYGPVKVPMTNYYNFQSLLQLIIRTFSIRFSSFTHTWRRSRLNSRIQIDYRQLFKMNKRCHE